MRTLIFAILTCLALSSVPMLANGNPKDVRLYLDFARFRYDESNTYLEIYYLLYDLNTGASTENVDVWLEFSLLDTKKEEALARENLKVTLDRQAAVTGGFETVKGSLIKTVLPDGDYQIKMVRMADGENSQKLDSLMREFSTGSFANEKITLSDLELCSNIKTNSKNVNDLFYKNTMEVFPNPTHMYGPQTPQLYYYIEAYNVQAKDPSNVVDVEIAIADTEGKIRAQKQYKRQRSYESLVEFGTFDVSKFENGLYTIIFAVVDSVEEYSVYRRSNFMVMDPAEMQRNENDLMAMFAQSDYFNMPEQDVDVKFDQITYITQQRQAGVYNSLTDVEAKRLFMFKFWREKEKEKDGLQDEYYERVSYANENYSFARSKTSGANGWKTDRGRVYILYGEPDRVISKPNTVQRRPYEQWQYHELQGGGLFLFVDESGYGDFQLRSSTIRGELYDPTWDEYLYRPETVD